MYYLDNRFFLALTHGDMTAMEEALAEITSPKSIMARSAAEGGYTDGLLSSYGFVYAKIAWRHGFKVRVDSPYVPAEWLPIEPLDHYTDPYEFMKAYTIK